MKPPSFSTVSMLANCSTRLPRITLQPRWMLTWREFCHHRTSCLHLIRKILGIQLLDATEYMTSMYAKRKNLQSTNWRGKRHEQQSYKLHLEIAMGPDRMKRQKSQMGIVDEEVPLQIISSRGRCLWWSRLARILHRYTQRLLPWRCGTNSFSTPKATTSATITFEPTSAMSIDEVQYCCFCQSLNHRFTKRTSFQSQISVKLIGTREANLPSILRHPWCSQPNTYCNCSDLKNEHYTSNTQGLVYTSTESVFLRPPSPLLNRQVANAPLKHLSMKN